MSDLDPLSAEHLYPVLKIMAAVVGVFLGMIGISWGGFVWLRGQIREIAEALVGPVAERALHAERSARRANQRVSRLRHELSLAPDLHIEDELETRP